MTLRSTGRMAPGEGEELVRRKLEDLALASKRHEPGGVSKADMARDLRVSPQRVDDMLDENKPAVNLRAGQILSLDPTARRAVLAMLNAKSRALDARGTTRSPESRDRRLSVLKGEYSQMLETFLGDTMLDDDEKRKLRAKLYEFVLEAIDGAEDLEPVVLQ